VLLLVLNNSGLQVLPTTVLTLRQAAGAQHPADIWGAMLISSAAATAAGVILLGMYDKIRQKGANPHGESRRRHPHPDRSADSSARKMRGR
jgi:spore maturation protein SpmA